MSYGSVTFIFYVFAGVALFYNLPQRARIWCLLLLSLGWVASWNPSWAILFFLIANLNYAGLRKAALLPALLVFDGLCFLFLRSGGFGAYTFVPPYGTSFFFFTLMGMGLDRWRKQDREDYSWAEFIVSSQFFLYLMAGPVEKGANFLRDLRKQQTFSLSTFTDGILLMSVGLTKFFLLWNLMLSLSVNLQNSLNHWAWLIPLGLINTWKVYIELSSLAGIGRGAARLFGLFPAVNFRPVIFSKSPADFWLRWNISVGAAIRNHVTIPLLLNFGRRIPKEAIIFFSFLLMGIWHGIGWNFVLFGLFNGAMVILFTWSEHRKMSPAVGYFLAVILMIGNGLIPHVFELNLSGAGPETPWEIFRDVEAASLITFGGYLLFEIVQERKKDPEFFLQWPLWVKGTICLFFIGLFFYALERNLLSQQKVLELPIYFKM